jgi:hypothetical protein
MRFGKEFEDRRLRLYFSDGRVCDGFIVDVAEPEDGDGFVFDPVADGTMPGDKAPGVWAAFTDLSKYEVLEK